jgi:hypothetical protein
MKHDTEFERLLRDAGFFARPDAETADALPQSDDLTPAASSEPVDRPTDERPYADDEPRTVDELLGRVHPWLGGRSRALPGWIVCSSVPPWRSITVRRLRRRARVDVCAEERCAAFTGRRGR